VRQARRSVQSGLHDHPRLVPPLAGASLKKGVKGPRPPLRLASHRRPPTKLVLPPDNRGDILPNRRQAPPRIASTGRPPRPAPRRREAGRRRARRRRLRRGPTPTSACGAWTNGGPRRHAQ